MAASRLASSSAAARGWEDESEISSSAHLFLRDTIGHAVRGVEVVRVLSVVASPRYGLRRFGRQRSARR